MKVERCFHPTIILRLRWCLHSPEGFPARHPFELSCVAMAFLKTVILLDEVDIISSNNYCMLHFRRLNNACKNPAANGNVTSEGTFLVNVGSFSSFTRNFEAK